MTTTWAAPLIAHAIALELPTVLPPEVEVVFGVPPEFGTMDYLCVGVSNPFSATQSGAIESTFDWRSATRLERDEAGTIRCLISTWDGDSMLAALTKAAEYLSAMETLLRDDVELGVATIWRTNVARVVWDWTHDTNGVFAVAMVEITYDADI